MADKKKFEKPQMEVIKLNSKATILAGSCSTYDCGSDETTSREFDILNEF